jgi:hypothetical protein
VQQWPLNVLRFACRAPLYQNPTSPPCRTSRIASLRGARPERIMDLPRLHRDKHEFGSHPVHSCSKRRGAKTLTQGFCFSQSFLCTTESAPSSHYRSQMGDKVLPESSTRSIWKVWVGLQSGFSKPETCSRIRPAYDQGSILYALAPRLYVNIRDSTPGISIGNPD